MSGDGPADTGVMTSLKRRETAISLIRTSVRYFAYGVALILALGALSFGGRSGTVAGASLIVVLIAFAAQRFLTDILAGFFMFFEGWFSVGDNITITPLDLQGVVDEVGLRSTRLRAINGEIVRVHNSYIQSVRVQPRGAREVEIEFFATSEDAGRDLVAEVARLVPAGPTRLVRVPWVEEVEQLDDDLVRIRARATVAHGREWLVETFVPDLIKERGEDVVVHGPIVWHVDESAQREFARTLGLRQSASSPPR
jgi:small conductance mechanosensitive channel